MREMTQSEIKSEALRVLLSFHIFCCTHKLKYSLACGTLLGGIRHKGFIPWDDDIDVMMPREDYEKLICLFKDHDNIHLISYKNNPSIVYPFVKLVSQNTYAKETEILPSFQLPDLGVWVDVFPVDKIMEKPSSLIWVHRDILAILFAFKERGYRPSSKKWKSFCKRMIYFLCSPFLGSMESLRNAVDTQILSLNQKDVNFCTHICCYKSIMPMESWNHLSSVEFEGHTFSSFSLDDAKTYLRQLYGRDFMTPPPIEKRIPHKMNAFWRE